MVQLSSSLTVGWGVGSFIQKAHFLGQRLDWDQVCGEARGGRDWVFEAREQGCCGCVSLSGPEVLVDSAKANTSVAGECC